MKSRLSSPLTINYLLSLYKNGPLYQKKYLQIYKTLKIKDGYRTSNRIFLSPACNAGKQFDTTDIDIDNIEFEAGKEASQCITNWINQYRSFSPVDIERHVLPSTTSLLCNISMLKGVWKNNQMSPVMKVHNSFSYTEDIKYEARLIELRMQDVDFNLVIIVPNDVSAIAGLFSKLVEDGLTAAVSCVQPLFTLSTVLDAPNIKFSSENNVCFEKRNSDVINGTQIANVQIDENGTNISILTLLSCIENNCTMSVESEQTETEAPFYFVVLYRDTAIFAGRYVKRVKEEFCK